MDLQKFKETVVLEILLDTYQHSQDQIKGIFTGAKPYCLRFYSPFLKQTYQKQVYIGDGMMANEGAMVLLKGMELEEVFNVANKQDMLSTPPSPNTQNLNQ